MKQGVFDYNSPVYMQIMRILKKRITDGIYQVNSLMPGENELCKEFDVSRVTVRSSLAILEKEGYIARRAGLGTIVCFNDPTLNKFTLVKSFTSEMKEIGQSSNTIYASLEEVQADSFLAKLFEVKVGTKLYNLKRIRGEESCPIVYSDSYLHLEIELPNTHEFLYGSLYEYLIKHDSSFKKMREIVEAEIPNQNIKEKLKILKNDCVLKRTRFSYGKNGDLEEYTVNYYNSNRYKYAVEINSNNK